MLKLPPPGFTTQPLATISQDAAAIVRVPPKTSGEPYIGRSGENRFDDPRMPQRDRFGTCYLGRSVVVAITETLLHNAVAVDGGFTVALKTSRDAAS